MKRKACAEVGIKSFDVDLPEQVLESELIGKVHELNALPDVHGWSVMNLIAYLNIIFQVDPRCDLSFFLWNISEFDLFSISMLNLLLHSCSILLLLFSN